MVRHPLDVIASTLDLAARMGRFMPEMRLWLSRFTTPVEALAQARADRTDALPAFAEAQGEAACLYRFEDLLAAPVETLTPLCTLLGAEPQSLTATTQADADPSCPGPGDWKTYAEPQLNPAPVGRWKRRCRGALLQGDLTHSFAELGALARTQGAALAKLGSGQGHRVILHLTNGPAAAALPAALWALGATPVRAPADLRPEVLDSIASRTSAHVVLGDSLVQSAATPAWHPATLTGHNAPLHGDSAGGISSIAFTSGYTSCPKGVVQLQSTLLNCATRVEAAIGFHAQDRLLCAVPFGHDYGWTQLLALYRPCLSLILPATPGLTLVPAAI